MYAPGDHGSTFAGNPLVSAAANAALDVIDDPAFLEAVRERGTLLAEGVAELPGVTVTEIVADLPGAAQAVYYMFNPPAGAERQLPARR